VFHDVEVVGATVGFEECFREHYPRLVALGASMSGSVDVGRELAQETMLRASRRWDEVASYDQPGAWLRRVMTNLLIDHHRSRAAERGAMERLARRAEVVADGPGDDDASWAVLLAELPARQRMIVTLYYADDRSIEEIAHMLGVATGTVKSSLGRARDRLHDRLTQEGRDGTQR
jgi:RNA polymerase sigma-70 factor (ECF subfamily)